MTRNRLIQLLVFLCVPVGFILLGLVKRGPVQRSQAAAEWFDEVKDLEQQSNKIPELREFGEEAVPVLRQALKSDRNGDRFKAAWALGNLGTGAQPAVPDLIQALDDPRLGVQINATIALAKIGVYQERLVPKLLTRLSHPDLGMSGCSGELLIRMEETKGDGEEFPIGPSEYATAFANASSPRARLMSLPKLLRLAENEELVARTYRALLNDTNGWVRDETRKFLDQNDFDIAKLGSPEG